MEKTTRRAGPKERYDWPAMQDGEWHSFVWKAKAKPGEEAFSCLPQSFVSALHRRGDADGFDVETRQPSYGAVEFRFTPKAKGRKARSR